MKNYIVFENGIKKYPCWVVMTGHIVTLLFTDTVPAESTMRGFVWIYTEEAPVSDYTAFCTVYRYDSDAGIYQMSDDGSMWIPTITFTSNGGTLTGDLIQHVSSYSDLIVPAPIDDEYWEFKNWNPTIQTTGKICKNESYQAVFEFIGTPPVPEPTTEERIEDVEVAICDLSEELSTSIADLETALCDLSTKEV